MVTPGAAAAAGASLAGAAPSRLAVWRRDLTDSLSVLVSPREAYRRLLPRRPLFVPWLLAALPSMILGLLVTSVAQRVSAHLLAGVDDPSLVRAVSQQLGAMKVFAVLAAPVALWLQWTVAALLLWAVAVFLLREVSFRAILSVVACASLPQVIGRGVDLAVVWSEGPEWGPDLLPRMTSATGLAGLLPAGAPIGLASLADCLGPFHVWSGVLWTIGIAVMGSVRLHRAVAVTVPVWTLVAVVNAALGALRASMTGLAGAWSGG